MKLLIHWMLIGVFGMLLLSGCATKRGEVALQTPTVEPTQQAVAPKGIKVYINAVSDARQFEARPSDPSTPSLDPNELQTEAIKSRAIGRKRGGFGKAFANFLLAEGQTVQSVIEGSLKQAFTEAGYTVVHEQSAVDADTYTVDVKIDKFWSWLNMGFWALTISTEISTGIDITKPDGKQDETVYVIASEKFQTGLEGNWIAVMQSALANYVDEVKKRI